MFDRNSILLYVTDVAASAAFYTRLLDQAPVEISQTFAMFPLPSGLGLGLWSAAGVRPAPAVPGGGCEVAFRVAAPDLVDALYEAWRSRGAHIALPPTDLDFGRSFVAEDPDGHRLRVYTMAGA